MQNENTEYEAAVHNVVLVDRSDRGLIEIAGKDRGPWLHNLVTNAVKTLQAGDGNYAFALNAKGRILFDCNIVVRKEAIWLDVDRQWVPKAMAHLERYHIVEDVTLADRSGDFDRLAIMGPRAAEVVALLGARQAAAMPSLASTEVVLAGKPRLLVRHDAVGVFGVELYIDQADAAACRDALLALWPGMRVASGPVLEMLRIEAGVPRYGIDIDEDVLPAETLQNERAVSFVKGCYLGQEVVERMRSRGALARQLVRLRFDAEDVRPGALLHIGENQVGRVTSVSSSIAFGGPIGLGYVKAAHAEPGTKLTVEAAHAARAEVMPLK